MTRPYLLRLAAGLALLLPAACTSPAPPAPNLTALFAAALHCRRAGPADHETQAAARLRAGQRLIAELLVDVAACRRLVPGGESAVQEATRD
ncbi:hypothetical protein DT376_07120, partial [Pseudomonas aeruginosa]